VAGGDEQTRFVYRKEGLELAFPRPGERTGYKALLLPGSVGQRVVLDLGQRTPEREALCQALGRPREGPEDVPPAKFVHLKERQPVGTTRGRRDGRDEFLRVHEAYDTQLSEREGH
jgi:hypothetical protein